MSGSSGGGPDEDELSLDEDGVLLSCRPLASRPGPGGSAAVVAMFSARSAAAVSAGVVGIAPEVK